MRTLQLKRFDIIFSSREKAIANLNAHVGEYKDGEIMAAAYHSTTAKTADDLMYVVGIYVDKGDTMKKLFFIDVKDLERQIGEIRDFANNAVGYVKDVKHVTASTYTSQTADKYHVSNNIETASTDFQLSFDALSSDDSIVPVTIGDITNGTKCSDLKGKPISEILDMIIFKTIYPSVTRNVSASLNANTGLTMLGSAVTLTSGYTSGQAAILFENGTRNYTANTSTNPASVSIKEGTTDVSTNVMPASLGDHIYTLTVNYGAGDKLKDSKGKDAAKIYEANGSLSHQSNPHAAGSVTASAKVNVSLPVYYQVGTGTQKGLPLQTWGAATWMKVSIDPIADSNKLSIKVPSGRTLAKVAVLNPNKSENDEASYDTDITSKMEKQAATETINNYTYNVYTSNGVSELNTFKYLIKIS